MNIGRYHIIIIHLPIALTLAAGAAEVLWLLLKRPLFRSAALYCLFAALLTAVPAVILGDILLDSFNGFEGSPALANLADRHADAGFASLGCLMVAATARWLTLRKSSRAVRAVYAVALAAAVMAISLAGHWGGELVYGKGFFWPL